MGEGGAKDEHCVITHISSKQSEAVHQSGLVLNNVKPNMYDDKVLGFASSAPTYDIANNRSILLKSVPFNPDPFKYFNSHAKKILF